MKRSSETKPDLCGDKLRFLATQDLASRHRFEPLFALQLEGAQLGDHLDQLFHRHGPPLFLKRDNGSNLLARTTTIDLFESSKGASWRLGG